MTPGERFRELRKDAGYSQPGLAKKLDKHQPTIAQYEIGERDLTPTRALEWCDAIGVGYDETVEMVARCVAAEYGSRRWESCRELAQEILFRYFDATE